jgi:tetratricopeptide (TPR) repeat protein
MHIFHFAVYVIIAIGLSSCSTMFKNYQPDNPFKKHSINLSHGSAVIDPAQVEIQDADEEITSADHERLGDINFSRKDFYTSFVQYEKAIKQDPDNVRLKYKKGLLFLVSGMLEDAGKEFMEIITKHPGFDLAYEGMGMVLFRMRRFDEAEADFLKAVELNPELWKSHNLLGVLYDYKKQYEKAIEAYKKAVALKPDNGDLYNNLGISCYLAGEYEQAVAFLEKALTNKNIQKKTYNNLGLALCKLGRYGECLEAFSRAGDEAQAYNNLGCIFLREGDLEQATRSFEKALAMRPSFYTTANENIRKCRLIKNEDLFSELTRIIH